MSFNLPIHGSRKRVARLSAVLALLLTGFVASDTMAQSRPGTGSRVRVSVPGRNLLNAFGTVREVGADRLVVQLDERMRVEEIRYDEIGSLAVSTGSHRQTLKGGGLGLLIGAVGGAALGLAHGDDPPCGANAWICWRWSAGDYAMLGAIGLGVVGGVAGLVAGALTKSEGWSPMAVTGTEAFVRPSPGGGRVDVGYRLR